MELMYGTTEDALLVSINAVQLPTAITYFSALRLGRLDSVALLDVDGCSDSAKSRLLICHEPQDNMYTVQFNNIKLTATQDWFDAVLCMLIDTSLEGWSHSAHIDQEFSLAGRSIILCIGVLAP